MTKLAPWVLDKTANNSQAEFLIVLRDQAELSRAAALPTKEEKGRFVRDALWNNAQATQKPLLAWLTQHKVEHRAFYIVNMIWVKGNRDLLLALAARPDVLRVEGNPQIKNVAPPVPTQEITESQPNNPEAVEAVETGVNYTRAPQVWAAGFTGQGIVVAGADTGYRWTHNALKSHYRGWNGSAASHDYNWHDSIHGTSTSVCGADSLQPCDDNGHGTHTMGTSVGDDGGANQIGMAPGAKWIGCRNMDAGDGTPARYIECMEFFLAPYPVGGTTAQGDASKAPDVTTNSWGCPASEGCSPISLQQAVEAQRAAGIMMVVAAGNSGSACSTVSDPPSFYQAVYTVGALNTGADTIASFSSRGPVTTDASLRRKPDISAPGTSTRSSYRTSDTAYTSLSGTSMATPHVAGAAALLLSARPGLKKDITGIGNALSQSAVHILSNACDTGSPAVSPNNTFGYGRLDVKAAVDSVIQIASAASRKTHAGSNYDMPLPLTGNPGIECRTGGANGDFQVIVNLASPIPIGAAAVSSGTGSVSIYSVSGTVVTVNLTGVANAQRLAITLTGTNGGVATGSASVPLALLVGDTNGDGSVNSLDISQTKAQSGTTLATANAREDMNLDGDINSIDISLVKAQSGSALP